MEKWYGKVGYAKTVETEPGIWEEKITEHEYYGDVVSARWKHQNSNEINTEVNISNAISARSTPEVALGSYDFIYLYLLR